MYLLLWFISLHCLISAELPKQNAAHKNSQISRQAVVNDSISVNAGFQAQSAQGSDEPLNSLTNSQQRNVGGEVSYGGEYLEPYDIDFKYHNYDRMTRFLRDTTVRYPSLTALYSIGKSVQGRYNKLL